MRQLLAGTFSEEDGRDRLDGHRWGRWRARPSLGHPLLAALVTKTGAAPRAKVGWTDAASFWEHGVPAANFGLGDPLLAHHPDEHVNTRPVAADP